MARRRRGEVGGGRMMVAGAYPLGKSPNKLPVRRRQEIDLDRWVEAGKLRFAWVIGITWIQAMAASDDFYRRFLELTVENPNRVGSTNVEEASQALIARAESGGMVLVDQDIYLRSPIGSELSDLVLPTATWGEADFSRCNGERRLRLYSWFYDPPGESKPDWWIIAGFAKKMGFQGYYWKEPNDVFEEAARSSRKGMLNYQPLVAVAKSQGKKGHELLREMGTTGIQTPIRLVDGELVGTQRLHDSTLELGPPQGPTVHPKWLTRFRSHSGEAVLNKSPWEWISDFYERIKPKSDELWVTNSRVNEVWQSAFDDVGKPYISQRWPESFVEIHPNVAAARGIESGDEVVMESNDILVQKGGFSLVKGDEFLFSKLEENGLIRRGNGAMEAVAMVTDAVRPGVVFAAFLWPRWPGAAANSPVHRVPNPITNRYRFKLGKGKLRKTGESPYKRSLERMSFKPRTII